MNNFKTLSKILLIQVISCLPIVLECGPVKVSHGHSSSIGRRPSMEDTHIIRTRFLPELTTSGLFAIFDGHGGDQVSKFVAQKFPSRIRLKIKSARAVASQRGLQANYKKTLFDTFKEIDKELSKPIDFQTRTTGSCAIVALKIANRLLIANLGDSRAILSRGGRAVSLSEDQKPDRPDEKERIIRARGTVETLDGIARLNGTLAVSRAFGDFAQKRTGLISTPEIKEIRIKPEDQFLILACDGIFEKTITRQKAVDIVKSSLRANRNKPNAAQIAAKALVDAAYNDGSNDNLSAIVVVFNHQ